MFGSLAIFGNFFLALATLCRHQSARAVHFARPCLQPLKSSSLLYHSVDSESGEFYYFNFATGETQWEHPLDEVYRQKVRLTDISVVIISLFSVHPTHSDMAF